MQTKIFFNYLVSFTDGTFKTGVTSSPFYRLQDFIQEAHRHSVKVDGFEITKPSKDKKTALKIESDFCKKYAFEAIDGHREWFKRDYSLSSKKLQRELYSKETRINEFKFNFYILECFWKKRIGLRYLCLITKNRKIKKNHEEIQCLASELGSRGVRIKARLATQMMNDILSTI